MCVRVTLSNAARAQHAHGVWRATTNNTSSGLQASRNLQQQ
jgi:hypothetical protein